MHTLLGFMLLHFTCALSVSFDSHPTTQHQSQQGLAESLLSWPKLRPNMHACSYLTSNYVLHVMLAAAEAHTIHI
jgi:hypothetical protein